MTNCENIDQLENGSLKFISKIKCDSIDPYSGSYKISENQQNYFILLIVAILILLLLVYWSNKFSV